MKRLGLKTAAAVDEDFRRARFRVLPGQGPWQGARSLVFRGALRGRQGETNLSGFRCRASVTPPTRRGFRRVKGRGPRVCFRISVLRRRRRFVHLAQTDFADTLKLPGRIGIGIGIEYDIGSEPDSEQCAPTGQAPPSRGFFRSAVVRAPPPGRRRGAEQ